MEQALPPYATPDAGLTVTFPRSSLLVSAGRHRTEAERRREEADDRMLASLLISMQSLVTGRRLPDGVPPDQLSEEELIAFWADDTGWR